MNNGFSVRDPPRGRAGRNKPGPQPTGLSMLQRRLLRTRPTLFMGDVRPQHCKLNLRLTRSSGRKVATCLAYIGFLTVGLAYTLFEHAGIDLIGWNVCLLTISLSAAIYWLLTPANRRAPAREALLRWPVLLLPAYVGFQLVPLPSFCSGSSPPSAHRSLPAWERSCQYRHLLLSASTPPQRPLTFFEFSAARSKVGSKCLPKGIQTLAAALKCDDRDDNASFGPTFVAMPTNPFQIVSPYVSPGER